MSNNNDTKTDKTEENVSEQLNTEGEEASASEIPEDAPDGSEKPHSRSKRSLINVPERNNVGPDGQTERRRSSRDTMEMEMKHDTNNGETKTGNENWNSLRQKMSYYPYQKMNEFTAPTGEQAPVETDGGNSTERTENNLHVIRNECNRRSISDTPNILHTGLSNLREEGF